MDITYSNVGTWSGTNDPISRIYNYVCKNEGAFPEEIAERLGLPHNVVSSLTAEMAYEGLLGITNG